MDPVVTLGLVITVIILGITFWLYKDDIGE